MEPIKIHFFQSGTERRLDNPNICNCKIKVKWFRKFKNSRSWTGTQVAGIDLNGTRIDNPNEVDKFKLTYIVDYSESHLVNNLENDINSEIFQKVQF